MTLKEFKVFLKNIEVGYFGLLEEVNKLMESK